MKIRIIIGTMFLALLTFGGYAGLVNAHTFKTGDNVAVNQSQKIDDTLFVSGRNVDVSSEVYGDVFCAGQTVTISGTVHGDVICAGQTVNIIGIVEGDIRAAGQTVTVGAQVTGNTTIAGQTFSLSSNAKINGDLSLGAADGIINGTIGRDLAVGGGNVTVSNQVGRNIKGSTENLKLDNGAQVKGNIEFTSSNEINRASNATVGGKITRTDPPKQSEPKRGAVFGFGIVWFIYWFLAMLLTALALVLLFPGLIHRSTERAIIKPWKAPLVGFIASILVPITLIILAGSVIGLPLAFVVALLWLVVIILSGPFFGYYVGRLLLRDSKKPVLIMLLGSSLLLVLYFIPVFGVLAFVAALWVGSGTILLELMDRTPKPVYNLPSQQITSNKRSKSKRNNKE